jgi:hypothetical protein
VFQDVCCKKINSDTPEERWTFSIRNQKIKQKKCAIFFAEYSHKYKMLQKKPGTPEECPALF